MPYCSECNTYHPTVAGGCPAVKAMEESAQQQNELGKVMSEELDNIRRDFVSTFKGLNDAEIKFVSGKVRNYLNNLQINKV